MAYRSKVETSHKKHYLPQIIQSSAYPKIQTSIFTKPTESICKGEGVSSFLPPTSPTVCFLFVHRTSAARQLPAMQWIHFCQSLLEYGKHMESHKRSLSCCALHILHSMHNGCVSGRDETVTHFTMCLKSMLLWFLSLFSSEHSRSLSSFVVHSFCICYTYRMVWGHQKIGLILS